MAIEDELAAGIRFHQAGDLAKAEGTYKQILAWHPEHAHALHLLGVVRHQKGDHEHSIELIRRAIAIDPGRAEFHGNLALVLAMMKRWDEAIAAFEKAVELQPGSAQMFFDFANALAMRKRLEDAAGAYRRALELKGDFAEAHNNLGNVLRELGRAAEAVAAYREALKYRSDLSAAEFNLAAALEEDGKRDEAIEGFRKLVARFPNDYLAQNALGAALGRDWKLDEAETALREALRIRPGSAESLNNLAAVLKEMGRLEEALDCFREALKAAPDFLVAHDNYLLMIHYSDRFDGPGILAEMKKWNERYARPTQKLARRERKEKLRVGYVSPDFADHVVGRNIFPLFREHDRNRFEIFGYSNLLRGDRITEQFRQYCDQWREVGRMPDEALAELIRQDEIDVLVDLAGHTHRNRLLTFARRAAPVQVTFGGYPGGTGLAEMDFHLTDKYLDPPGQTEGHYVEKLVRMPDSFWCYDPEAMGVTDGPVVGELPARGNGFVTFGCLNNLGKISARTRELWSKVLKRVPGSRILLLAPEGSCRRRIIEKLGIEGERVLFMSRVSRIEYLAAYNRIDLALDSLPYGCHTTGLDCLWMGVPLVTRVGETAAGRAGFSHLSNLGMTELVAWSDEEFVELAAGLAGDLDRLASLRAGIRQKMIYSPLTDGKRFARNVEGAYLEMIQSNAV
jgi:protein O-GlcNAc transferase